MSTRTEVTTTAICDICGSEAVAGSPMDMPPDWKRFYAKIINTGGTHPDSRKSVDVCPTCQDTQPLRALIQAFGEKMSWI